MNRDLQELVRKYATETHSSVNAFLIAKSKDNLVGMLMDLLTNYFNDKNSSTLREHVIVSLCGYRVSAEKLGYNGYRQDGLGGKTHYCEAKPKNINTGGNAKARKLDGGGNFTDYTWGRFGEHAATNPEMIIGGFLDGRLLYVLRFPFNTPDFTARLKAQLEKRFPSGKDESGVYLRSASFTLKHYETGDVSVAFVAKKPVLAECQKHLSKSLFDFLQKHAGD